MNDDQKLLERYNHHKKTVLKWESVFSKTEGRDPIKTDFEYAPEDVKHSYKRYIEIKKYYNARAAKVRANSSKSPGKRTPKKKLTPKKIFTRFNSRFSSSSSLECLTPTKPIGEDGSSPSRPHHPQSGGFKPRSAKKSPKTPFYRKFSSRLFDISSVSSSSLSLNDSLPSASSSSSLTSNMKENKFELSLNSSGEEQQSITSSEPFSRTNSEEFQEFNSESLLSGTNLESIDFPLPNISKDCSPNIMRLIDPNWKVKKDHLPFHNLDSVVNTHQQQQQIQTNSVSFVINPEPVIPVSLSFKNDSQKLRKVDQSWLDRCVQNEDERSTPMDQDELILENSVTFTINPDSEHVIIPAPIFNKTTANESVSHSQTHGFKLIDAQTTEISEQFDNTNTEIEIPSTSSTITIIPSIDESSNEVNRSSQIDSNTRKRKVISPIKLRRTGDVYEFIDDSDEPKQKGNKKKSKNKVLESDSKKRRKVSNEKFVVITNAAKPAPKKSAKKGVKNIANANKSIVSHPVELDPTMTGFDIFDETDPKGQGKQSGRGSRKKRQRLSKPDYFAKKLDTGRVNENFVRIDITKKVFVRGRKKMTGQKMKQIQWKLNKSVAAAESKIKLSKCRSCGEIGHFAKFCMKGKSGESTETQNDSENLVDESPFPTLEEAARMVWSKKASEALHNRTVVYNDQSQSQEVVQTVDASEQVLAPVPVQFERSSSFSQHASFNQIPSSNVPCIETLNPVLEPQCSLSSLADEIQMLKNGLGLFGYPSFRSGQQQAVSRILRGQSTLVILSTGSGKSLCYMLPAYLYAQKYPGCLTLCVSPLVSLMEDQVQNMPPFLNGACLHTNMSEKQREKVLESVRSKKLNLLLVSPEAVCGGLFGLLRDVQNFPPIAFACIDEVHCVSQWSHNFRPSYLKLCKILREKLNVRTILGLTATATNQTTISICDHINTEPSSVIRGEIIPNNLRLSVSRDQDREEALLRLLRGKRFADCGSIIIYCTRREQCERIATLIRTRLQDSAFKSEVTQSFAKQRISSNCEAYHAGMSAQRRRLVQNQFMSGKIRIVVATVAFGMGIDKSDIRAVLHYNMPKTFESYVQEIGRAGRDGLPAECHLFLDSVKGKDLCELKRHVYSNSVDRPTIRKLLSKIFRPCKCENIEKMKGNTLKLKKECPGHEISFSVESIVKELDLPEENVETLLCYLELDPTRKWVEMLPKCYQTCTIQSYGGAKLFKTAAATCPPLAVAIALQKERKKFKEDDVYLQFNLVEVASTVGWNSAIVRKEIKSLEWTGTQFNDLGKAIKYRKSGFLVEFSDLAYRMIAPGNLSDEESDTLLNSLHGHNYDQERTQLYQLHRVHQALQSVSVPNVGIASRQFDEEKSDALKKFVFEYFQQSNNGVPTLWKPPTVGTEKEESIRRDVANLIASCKDYDFTSRAVAKIFQGIPSPCYPSQDWYRNRSFWRKYLDVDFHYLCQLAAEELS